MEKNELNIERTAPLHPLDSETQTFGCRHDDPDICGNHSLNGVCAFVNKDKLCKKPPRTWRKLFLSLKNRK